VLDKGHPVPFPLEQGVGVPVRDRDGVKVIDLIVGGQAGLADVVVADEQRARLVLVGLPAPAGDPVRDPVRGRQHHEGVRINVGEIGSAFHEAQPGERVAMETLATFLSTPFFGAGPGVPE
jgi:hypothetical protein